MFYKWEDIKKKSKYNTIAERDLKENAKEVIIKGIAQLPHADDWDHDALGCGFSKRCTEKRWCRCLVNFTKTENTNKSCDKCFLKKEYAKPIENARFTDFEVPASSSSGDKIGEIDVILEYEGKEYCTEVKPKWNGESLLRMIAEIITYCHVRKEKRDKAIMFEKGSEQYWQWTGQKNGKPYRHAAREQIKKIIKDNDITVFCIEDKGNTYRLEKLN